MSEPVPYAIRHRIFTIRQDLDRLAGERKSIAFAVAASADADYLRHQLPGIDTLCRELEAELGALEAEFTPKTMPPEPGLSVRETEAHLEKLLGRIGAAERELAAVKSRLPKLRTDYEAAVIGDGDVGASFSELEAARHQEAELLSSLKILRCAIPGIEGDLERAKAARGKRERAHWAAIATKLPVGVERWAAMVAAKARPGSVVNWPESWGRKPTSSERVAAMGVLAQKYPFQDNDDGNATV